MQLDNLSFALLGIIFIIFFIVLIWINLRSVHGQVRKQLFEKEKRAFLGQLDIAVHRHLLVLPSLSITDIFKISFLSKLSIALRFNSSTSFDFTLYHRKTMEVCCVINLIPYRHKQGAKNYNLLRQLCKSAELPLLEYEAKPWRDITELSRTVLSACGINDQEVVDFEITTPREKVREIKGIIDINCPKCKCPMQLKKLNSGSKAGLECWICTKYPTCNGARKVQG